MRGQTLSSGTAERACPLCGSGAQPLLHDQHGEFWSCANCRLAFRDPREHLDFPAQLERYREHRNSVDDPRYLEFLDRLATPLAGRLAAGARGLDYGSGPAPGMAALFGRRGFQMISWDPLFPSDDSALDGAYDFVTCSEVLEHIPQPNAALDRMAALVPRGGWIGIMTQFRRDDADFARWWYRRDPTHVCFYSEQTMRWIGARRGWAVEVAAPNVTLFRLLPGAG